MCVHASNYTTYLLVYCMDTICRLLTIDDRGNSTLNNATTVSYITLQLKPDSRLPFYILYDETLSLRPIRCHSFLFSMFPIMCFFLDQR